MSNYLEAVASVGPGSLHPGGFAATLELLDLIDIKPDSVVLDIGCGSGRTACYIAKKYGPHVFALDKSEKMLAKARVRALFEGAEVNFVHGDALDMPFAGEVADVVLLESVLVFLPALPVLVECRRVLKKEGILAVIELFAGEKLGDAERKKIEGTCGLHRLLTLKEWLAAFEKAGFSALDVRYRGLPGPLHAFKEMLYPDTPLPPAYKEPFPDCWKLATLARYKSLIVKNYRKLGFAVFLARK